MRSKYIYCMLVCFIASCKTQSYLPQVETITDNVYGSYIDIEEKSGRQLAGELISFADNRLIILQKVQTSHSLEFTDFEDLKKFKLKYANGKNYAWSIPVYTLGTIFPMPNPDKGGGAMPFHGFFAVITLPVNLITTIIVTTSANNAFTYTNTEITKQQLKMFARYPQGIPAQIKLADIK